MDTTFSIQVRLKHPLYLLLPEGANKEILCRVLRIDENDFFGLLLAVAQY